MAINPLLRPTNFDVPTYPASGVRVDPSVWSNISSLGDAIGARREQSAVADLMRSATDDSGNLDLNKAATAIALSGRDPIKYINALTAQSAERRGEAAQKALEAHYVATQSTAERTQAASEAYQKEMLRLREQEIQQGKTLDFTVDDPLGIKPQRRFRKYPDGRTEEIPIPAGPAKPPVPGPQSALPEVPGAPGPQLALNSNPAPPPEPPIIPIPPGNVPIAPRHPMSPFNRVPPIGPGGAPGERIGEQLPLPLDPENAPPYRVAGPMMAPPGTTPPAVAAPAVPAPGLAAREAALKQFEIENGPDAAAVFRDILDYKRGLPGDDKRKQGWITAARQLDPTFDPDRYANVEAEKKKPMTQEQGKSMLFANRMDNAEPDIQNYIDAAKGREGVVGNIADKFLGGFGSAVMSPDYQVYNRAKYDWISGALRWESGAAINADEYVKAEKAFFPGPNDDPKTIAAKEEARRVETEAMRSAAGPGFKSVVKPRPVANDEEANAALKRADEVLSGIPAGNRDAALKEVRKVLRDKHVPPNLWPH